MYEEKRLAEMDRRRWNPDTVIHEAIAQFLPTDHRAKVLDYGAGNSPYRNCIACTQYVRADLNQNTAGNIDCIIEPGKPLALSDADFELILLLDVLEHVEDPSFVLDEVCRLLKPGGRVIVSLPFVYREHETPYDFTRYTSYGAQALFTAKGGRILRMMKVGNTIYTLFTLFLERGIMNGEESELSAMGILMNRALLAASYLLRGILRRPPAENAGIYHHILLEVEFP